MHARKFLLIAALGLLAMPAVAADAVSFRLNWYLGGLHVPFYYGKDRGFYAAEGIDLTINEGRGSANTCRLSPPARTRSGSPTRRASFPPRHVAQT